MHEIELACFDFDGVIWGSEEILYQGVVAVYERFGHSPIPSFKEIWQSMTAPYSEWWRSLGFSEDINLINECYWANADISKAQPKPDALAMLADLRMLGIPCYIVSASPTATVSSIVAAHHLGGFFSGIYGGAEHTKDECIRLILAKHRVSARHAIMVGDRPSDIRDGRNAYVITVAYTGGHPSEELLGRSAPDYLLTSLHDLVPLFFPSFDRISHRG